ncbi:unnamed protein product [Dovyalis caffra]|uniref:Uncharacterized protein n=1 Tax=Dovyalis caffra TaxID=77055 RepID=A0AAV1RM82_9ROSI|nr:unnamed protein product [Dovyalis caffra]
MVAAIHVVKRSALALLLANQGINFLLEEFQATCVGNNNSDPYLRTVEPRSLNSWAENYAETKQQLPNFNHYKNCGTKGFVFCFIPGSIVLNRGRLIMGAGPVGLITLLAASAFGVPRVVIVDVDDQHFLCMPFSRFKREETVAVGVQVLNLKLPFEEIEVLCNNLELIKRQSVFISWLKKLIKLRWSLGFKLKRMEWVALSKFLKGGEWWGGSISSRNMPLSHPNFTL